MRPQDIIRHKRDGGELSRAEIEAFVGGVVEGVWADYQSSALLMAVYLNGMTTFFSAARRPTWMKTNLPSRPRAARSGPLRFAG